jgi:hypothetical protein
LRFIPLKWNLFRGNNHFTVFLFNVDPFTPVLVVAIRKILSEMPTSAFHPGESRVEVEICALSHVL